MLKIDLFLAYKSIKSLPRLHSIIALTLDCLMEQTPSGALPLTIPAKEVGASVSQQHLISFPPKRHHFQPNPLAKDNDSAPTKQKYSHNHVSEKKNRNIWQKELMSTTTQKEWTPLPIFISIISIYYCVYFSISL